MLTIAVQINLWERPRIERQDLFIWWLHLGLFSVAVSPGSLSARLRKVSEQLKKFVGGRKE